MSDFSINISTSLIDRLTYDGEKLKKKTRRPKTKTARERQQQQTKPSQKHVSGVPETQKETAASGWPIQAPLFLPVPPPPVQSANKELDAIRSVLHESEKVLEKLQKHEEIKAQQVTEKAKDLHDKEANLPIVKPMPCVEENKSWMACYKEHKNPLKCALQAENFANCTRRVRQLFSSK